VLTVTDSPFSNGPSDSGSANPEALSHLSHLTKLRIGHSSRMHDLRGQSLLASGYGDVAAELAILRACHAARGLLDLTLDAHHIVEGRDIQAIVSGMNIPEK
jgi:hypothetical protein